MECRRIFAIFIVLGVLATACASEGLAVDDASAPATSEEANVLALVEEPEPESESESTTTTAPSTTTAVAPTTTESTTTIPSGPTTTTTIDISTTTIDFTTSTILQPVPVSSCEAPSLETRFVNVDADNNGGKLNARRSPGTDFEVSEVLDRGTTAFTVGACRTVDDTNWWAIVASDGDAAWVAGQFLSAEPVLDPGVGSPIDSSALVGFSAATLDGVVAGIANSLGFVGGASVSASEVTAQDASGFRQTFTLTGLTNETTNGFVADLQLTRVLSEDGTQLINVTVLGSEISPLCTRGVSPEGRCI